MATEYRLNGYVTLGSESYEPGDTVELSNAAAAAFADVLEETDGSDSDGGDVTTSGSSGEQNPDGSSQDETEDGSETESEDEDDVESEDADAAAESESDDSDDEDDGTLDYDSLTVPELGEKLEEKDVSDAELEQLLEYEKQNKDRTGAKKALQSHLDDGDSDSE